MKNVTNNSMKYFSHKTVIATMIGLVALAILQGCDTGANGKTANPATQVEVVSPTGCLKNNGRYYDPKIKQCVEATSKQQANVLLAYSNVSRMAEEGKVAEAEAEAEAEYDIYPKTYISMVEAEMFWSELRTQGAKILMLAGSLPDNKEYDALPGKEQEGLIPYKDSPKTWGGPNYIISSSCGWHNRNDKPADTIRGMLEEGLKTIEADTFLGPARPYPQLRKAILTNGDCRFREINVTASPKVMLDFWNRHLDDLDGIQPRETTLDKVMPGLGPMQPYLGGK